MLKKEYRDLKKRIHTRNKTSVENLIIAFQTRTQAELSSMIGITKRMVRALVQELRLEGKAICGDDTGYYIADKADELSHTINIFKLRIKTSVDVMFALEEKQKAMRKAEK